jgi:predicted nuclease of predicted toxin-antitoxin system
MFLLANENISNLVVTSLRDHGHDVYWVTEQCPGMDDEHVLEKARTNERILVTFDKDYYRLVNTTSDTLNLDLKFGIIVFRTKKMRPNDMSMLVNYIIDTQNNWKGRFTIINKNGIYKVLNIIS